MQMRVLVQPTSSLRAPVVEQVRSSADSSAPLLRGRVAEVLSELEIGVDESDHADGVGVDAGVAPHARASRAGDVLRVRQSAAAGMESAFNFEMGWRERSGADGGADCHAATASRVRCSCAREQISTVRRAPVGCEAVVRRTGD